MRVAAKQRPPLRWALGALLALGLWSPAAAADLGMLGGTQTVGPATFTRWSGFYFGGQVGYSNGNADFAGATQPGLAFALRNTFLENQFQPSRWIVLGTANNTAFGYGGLLGYNTQWQDLIVGVEGNVNRTQLTLNAPSLPLGRTTGTDGAGNAYTLQLSGTGTIANMDVFTARIRAGYVLGSFLPYGFIGAAFGLSSAAITATGNGIQYTSGSATICNALRPCFPFTFNSSFTRNSEVLYGYTLGGGLDYAVTQNIFVRGEFEWTQFNPPPGIIMSIATARLGAGLKF